MSFNTAAISKQVLCAQDLAQRLRQTDFSRCDAVVVGYGYMGKEYVKALRALKVHSITACSRRESSLESLRLDSSVTSVSGGYERLGPAPSPEALAIVAVPTSHLMSASRHLVGLGYRNLLIEKPGSLWSSELTELARWFREKGVNAAMAYNRVSYPVVLEARYRAEQEGGITSCHYSFTEMVDRIKPAEYSKEELARWGVANSLHVMSLAHALIGQPREWESRRRGSISWHPSESVFVGSGVSELDIPFSYHSDWGSKGRWMVEIHTRQSSYRFCPLEKILRKEKSLGDWEEISVPVFAPEVKTGIVEEVAAMLSKEIAVSAPLLSLEDAAALTRYGEEIFAYESSPK